MKKKGSVSEFGRERNEQLLAAFRAKLHLLGERSIEEIFQLAVKSAAPRFYVGEKRAAEVMDKIDRGESIGGMVPSRREMYLEIHRRVEAYRREHPGCSTNEATFYAVNSEAPEFYITPGSCRVILCRFRRAARA